MAIPVDAARRVAKGNPSRAWLLRGARKDNSRCTLSARPVGKARVCIEPPAVPGQTLTESCVAGHNHCQVKHVERGPHPEKMPAVHDWKVVSPESRVDVRIVLLSSHEGLRSNILSDMPFRKRKVLWFLPRDLSDHLAAHPQHPLCRNGVEVPEILMVNPMRPDDKTLGRQTLDLGFRHRVCMAEPTSQIVLERSTLACE